jgi:hypothetical protein
MTGTVRRPNLRAARSLWWPPITIRSSPRDDGVHQAELPDAAGERLKLGVGDAPGLAGRARSSMGTCSTVIWFLVATVMLPRFQSTAPRTRRLSPGSFTEMRIRLAGDMPNSVGPASFHALFDGQIRTSA